MIYLCLSISLHLDVPKLSLVMGSNSLSQDILEGSNVYFECDIKVRLLFVSIRSKTFHYYFKLINSTFCLFFSSKKANPYVDVFGWKLNGEIFNISTISGLEERNTSLLITNVNHRHYGQYQCYAANSIGQSESESVFLDIKCLYQFWFRILSFFFLGCSFFFGFRFASNIQSVSISNMFLNEEWEERKVKFYYIILMQWSREHDAHYWFASVIRFKIHLHNSFCRQGIVLRLQNYFESKLAQNHTFDRPNWDFGKFENFRKSISNSS